MDYGRSIVNDVSGRPFSGGVTIRSQSCLAGGVATLEKEGFNVSWWIIRHRVAIRGEQPPPDPGTLLLFTDRCVSSSDTASQYGHEEADHLRAPEPEPGGGEPSHFNVRVIVAWISPEKWECFPSHGIRSSITPGVRLCIRSDKSRTDPVLVLLFWTGHSSTTWRTRTAPPDGCGGVLSLLLRVPQSERLLGHRLDRQHAPGLVLRFRSRQDVWVVRTVRCVPLSRVFI